MINDVEKTAEIFKALSSKTRLDIVLLLLEQQECSVNTIAEKLNLPQSNISQHLTILKSAGIVLGYRKGTQINYRVVDEQTEKFLCTKNIKL